MILTRDQKLTLIGNAIDLTDILPGAATHGQSPVYNSTTNNYEPGTVTGAALADGDKGDITVSSSGATWTIDAGVVTLAKMANMATASLIYRKTASSGAPEVNTLATLKTDLGLTGTNSGDNTVCTSGAATTAVTLLTARAIYGNNFDGSAALTQIIASTFGGTGNGFTKFSGPTTAERTKTLRDATDTILELGGSYTPTGTWTSMTLVTPALGTPASGVVTNLTGTASININGTVGATTPGTGAFTTLSATGVATHTAALDITPETITYHATTMVIDAATSNKKYIVLGGNGIINDPTNPVDGRVLIFRLRQDGTGTRVPTWGSKYRFNGDLVLANVVLSTAINKIDRIAFEYVLADDAWDCISFCKGS